MSSENIQPQNVCHQTALSVSTARPYSYRVGVEVVGRACFTTSGHLVKCWSMMSWNSWWTNPLLHGPH